MNVFVERIDNDGTIRDGQDILARFGNLIGKVNQHVEAHAIYFGLIGIVRRGIGQCGHAAVINLADIFRQRDDKILQALHFALDRIDGDLLIERVHIAFNDEPESYRQKPLAIDREGVLGKIQEILS